MKYLTYLMGTNVPNLKNIASRIGHFTPENSKQRLASGIIRRVTRKPSLAVILEELSDQAFQLLRYLELRPRKDWRLEDFACFREIWSEPEIFHGMNELVHSGIVGVTFESATEQEVFTTFDEIDPLIREILELIPPDPFEKSLPPRDIHSHPDVWPNDLLTLLGYVGRNRLQLTKRDQLHKRDADALGEILLGQRLLPLEGRFRGGREDWTEAVLARLFAAEILVREDREVVVADHAFDRLLERIATEREFARLLAKRCHGEGTAADIEEVLNIVEEAARHESAWHAVSALERTLCPVIDIFEEGQGPRLVRALLYDLMLLGVVDLGESESAWCWRPRRRTPAYPADFKEFLHIQPNFEIVAAPNLPLPTRAVLEQIAELVSVDQLHHYRITRESVYLGLCNGWTAQAQIAWHEEHSGGRRPLPQNIRHSIEDWGKSFGRLSLEHPLLLVCDTPELAEDLYHSKEIGPFCIGRYTENSLLLRKDSPEEVFAILRGMGRLPNPGVGDGARWAIDTHPPRKNEA